MSYPVSVLSLLHAHQRVAAVVLRQAAHQTHQLLVLLAVQLQLLTMSPTLGRRFGDRHAPDTPTNCSTSTTSTQSRTALLQALAVALHDVGHDAVAPVGLAGEELAALGTGAGASIALALALCVAPRFGPVARDAGLAESVVTRQGHWLLEDLQADGARQVPAKPLRRRLGHLRRHLSHVLLVLFASLVRVLFSAVRYCFLRSLRSSPTLSKAADFLLTVVVLEAQQHSSLVSF